MSSGDLVLICLVVALMVGILITLIMLYSKASGLNSTMYEIEKNIGDTLDRLDKTVTAHATNDKNDHTAIATRMKRVEDSVDKVVDKVTEMQKIEEITNRLTRRGP